jgi:Holliday junction DNA helicase RuvA
MLSRIQGVLLSVQDGTAEVRCGDACYEILVPACDGLRLSASLGETIEFHTLQYLESHGQGASYLPRLIGFASRADRAFFQLFTTVKGLGNRKALRALQLPFARIAEAIAEKDLDLLVSLPEIGQRTAQAIVTDLAERVDRFVEVKPSASPLSAERGRMVADAAAVLASLGESRSAALRLAERAATADATIDSAERLIAAALHLRETGA